MYLFFSFDEFHSNDLLGIGSSCSSPCFTILADYPFAAHLCFYLCSIDLISAIPFTARLKRLCQALSSYLPEQCREIIHKAMVGSL